MIEANRSEFPVALMCKSLGVSRSGFYAWSTRPESPRSKENRALSEEIQKIFEESREVHGSPRIHADLREQGVQVGRKRVARLMRDKGLRARSRRRYRVTTDSKHDRPTPPNLLDRKFVVEAPNRVWASDITYFWTNEGWTYLAVVIDLFSRKVVGWALADHMRAELVLTALGNALEQRAPKAGLVHHSDRGTQYACDAHRVTLDKNGIKCSMSRKGNCWDNAVVESFFGTLKTELDDDQGWLTKAQLRRGVFEYIEVFYNRKRSHSFLGYVSPERFEEQATKDRNSGSRGDAA